MNRALVLAFGLAAAFVAASAAAEPKRQDLGYDTASGSVCVFDKSTPPQCVPIGTVDSSGHAFTPRLPFTQPIAGAATRMLDERARDTLSVLDFRTSPTQGNGTTDDGPMFRAALAACSNAGGNRAILVPQPPVVYKIKSLDPSGLGGLVFGDGTHEATCDLIGETRANVMAGNFGGTDIDLGPNLNRPLIYVRSGARTPLLRHLRLSGAGQSGWAGGPNGKLYTIQVESGVSTPEGSINLDESYVVGGYNGNLYIGWGRGAAHIDNTWFQYGGQGSGDYNLMLWGYDTVFNNPQVGPFTGSGWRFGNGSQWQIFGGSTFGNTINGVEIDGDMVGYIGIFGMNFNANGCHGITDTGATPGTNLQAAEHALIGATFDANSYTTTNTCSDIVANNNKRLNVVSPAFIGSSLTTLGRPAYNIAIYNGGSVTLTSPSFSASANATAWTNAPESIRCTGCYLTNTWTPTFYGATTAGTPAFYSRSGYWSRNGNEVTVRFSFQTTSLGGAAGNMLIGGLPIASAPSASAGLGYCTISSVTGWTAQSGRTWLSGIIGASATTINLYENGSAVTSVPATATEFAAGTVMQGTCVYPVQ